MYSDYENNIISVIKKHLYKKETKGILGGFDFIYTNIDNQIDKIKIKVTISTCSLHEPTLEINDSKINNYNIQYKFLKNYFYDIL